MTTLVSAPGLEGTLKEALAKLRQIPVSKWGHMGSRDPDSYGYVADLVPGAYGIYAIIMKHRVVFSNDYGLTIVDNRNREWQATHSIHPKDFMSQFRLKRFFNTLDRVYKPVRDQEERAIQERRRQIELARKAEYLSSAREALGL